MTKPTEKNIAIIKEQCFKSTGSVNGRCNASTWWISRGLAEVYSDVLEYTHFLPENCGITRRIYHYTNSICELPICENADCENRVNWQVSTNSYSRYCSKKCNAVSNKKFGNDNPFSQDSVKKKIKQTNLEKYGADNYAKTTAFSEQTKRRWGDMTDDHMSLVRQKREQTCLARYGTITPFLNPLVKEKITDTLIERYGVSSPLQNQSILQKAIDTTYRRYNRKSVQQIHLSSEFLENLKDKEWVLDQLSTKSIRQLASENGMSFSNLCKVVNSLGIDTHNYSSFEKEVIGFLRSIDITDIVIGDRTILNGQEIDIYIPSLKLGIECNGVYWHSEVAGGRDKYYHLKKTEIARSKGVRLVHVFDTEWYQMSDQVKNRLRQMCGIVTRVQARKCSVIRVGQPTERDFLSANHLQGYVRSSVCYGLSYGGEIVAIMSFGKSRFSKEYEWELLRLSFGGNYTVVGGSEKLLTTFIREFAPRSLISYCDRRWFNGNVYERLGFSFLRESPPSHYYLEKDGSLSNRLKYQKHKLPELLSTFDSSLTAWDNMRLNGYDRIWDCGNFVYGIKW